MKKNLLKLVVLLCLASAPAVAQTVSGRVTNSADGSALPGVSVLVKGTSTGTSTDSDGRFSINVPDPQNSLLVFSFIGFATQEVQVNNRTSIDLSLLEDITQLNEVVVTALGIERDTRTLAYSVSSVDGENLTQAREVNVANALVGRVAGVNVGSVAGGPGSSSNITIRGVTGIGGSPPLYVINGVPIDNSNRGSAGMWGGADLGDGIANINPDDIASMTVLKGATAAALYGSRAAGGVILITTKTGKGQRGFGVELNSNYTTDRVMNLTDFQYVYGQGANGVKPATQTDAHSTESSWGGLLDGSPVPQFDGVSRPYSAQKDNIKNFYQPGSTFTNTLSLSASSDKTAFRFSVSDLNNSSIVPNSGMDRNTFNLNLNYKVLPKLTFDLVSNYVMEDHKNRPNLSDSPGNSNYSTVFMATSYDVKNFAPGWDPVTGAETRINANNQWTTNPWFAAKRFVNNTERDRLINIITLKYNLTDWLTAQARIGNDSYFDRRKSVTPTGTAYRAAGDLNESSVRAHETNADFLLTANKKISEKIDLTVIGGGNVRKNRWEELSSSGSPFSVPFLYVIGNTGNRNTGYGLRKTETQSLYYSIEAGFNDMLFISTTGRRDWFSVLDGRAIFYPSAGASFVFSELADLPLINFGKVRASWTQSSSDPTVGAYQTALYYNLSGSANGFPLGQIANPALPNSDLAPNQLTEVEIGLDVKLLDNRIGLDVAYYNRKTTDEPINVTTSVTSGYTSASLNVGSMENKGFEILLTGTPVKTNDFSWDISFNYTKNENKVLKLNEGLKELRLAESRSQNAYVSHVPGEAASQVMAFDFSRDPSGNIIYNASGYPVRGELKPWGSGYHPVYGGINNELRYKGLNFSFLIDFKSGGKIFSATNYLAYIHGLHKNTLEGRDDLIIGEGVVNTGTTDAPVYVTNTTAVAPWNYYGQLATNVSSEFVYDASFVKLRQIIIGYNLPSGLLKGLPIQSANISLVARNVAILSKNAPNIDPEANLNNLVGQGLELAGVPPYRSYGFNLNIKF
jgi:TonB-linked SusC/RagA family outer membrane protein